MSGIILSLLKTRIALIILILVIFAILLYLFTPKPTQQPQQPIPTPTSISSNPNPSQIGTAQSVIEQIPDRKNKEIKGDQTIYSYPTPAETRDNLIITEGSQVVFERKVTVEPNFNHPILSETLKSFGTPDKEFKGSYYYGAEFTTYIYPSKGVAVVGNPLNNEVYEIHYFKPMSAEEYQRLWGEDLHSFEGQQEQKF